QTVSRDAEALRSGARWGERAPLRKASASRLTEVRRNKLLDQRPRRADVHDLYFAEPRLSFWFQKALFPVDESHSHVRPDGNAQRLARVAVQTRRDVHGEHRGGAGIYRYDHTVERRADRAAQSGAE